MLGVERSDNNWDMTIRERHGRTKITKNDVRTIRQRLDNGEKQQAIANDYGLNQSNISDIKREKLWSWLK